MLDRSLQLLIGTVEGLTSAIFPFLYGLLALVLTVGVMFLPIIVSTGLYKFLEGKVQVDTNKGVMVIGGVVQVLWIISCVQFIWSEATGG
ncbi:hypothetical protein VPBG_00157 [Vibrio phage helene 12B3]|uniref:hypothetical protein n=1 Tax=Vibrio phage helene 12B3 TaxID=573173 RepID=UPI0002C0CD69|nr:hypothetical protein VPBG_00157 [Vibrio phage helene 12B3]YP_009223028.1 hypothetical protein VPLG_00179 [Vibrio phage eugene 12A10]AGG57929.1 hypothetical protein VPBG_00157 [Vibrio phage helene 12B3]AGN51618.1 hypothetical protein VPLG_00179 [Vibrio phage eugene 12A10]